MRLTINFIVKKARQKINGEIPVYVRFTLDSKRVELSTGIYCLGMQQNPVRLVKSHAAIL